MPAADLRCDAEEVCQPLDRIEDAEESRKELAERGVEVSGRPGLPWGSFVFCKDPDGNGWALQAMTHRAEAA